MSGSVDGMTVSEHVSMSVQPPSAQATGYATTIVDSGSNDYRHRMLVGTAVTGLVRVEWVQARMGQLIPTNWSMSVMWQYVNSYMPLRFQVDDAQNLIVRETIEQGFEWLLLWEHDVLPPHNSMIMINEYMSQRTHPIVSGLYYTRGRPSEPLIYRGRGNSFYADWQPGDLVYADGVPTGFLLIHASILKAMWDESPTYTTSGQQTRKVFETPNKIYFDEETGSFNSQTGTSDLLWCLRVLEGDFLRKAGWGDYADQHPVYPFLVDTRISCKHINPDGEKFP